MAIKVVGHVEGLGDRIGLQKRMRSLVFREACEKLSKRTGIPMGKLMTDSQSRKFFNHQGIVWQESQHADD